MKLMVGVVAALLFATSAAAQTTATAPVPPSTCPAFEPSPTLPDGATATRQEMERANAAFQAWGTAYQVVVQCRHDEAEALRQQWEARVAEHNAGVEQLNTVNATWQTQAEVYNARTNRR